jgi:glycosyltransferase involved in cell wall biosynthesis
MVLKQVRENNKVLIITQSYPPRVSTSSRRPACLVKYLPEFGWNPVVLCQRWTADNCVCDPEFVPGMPDHIPVAAVPGDANPRWSRRYFIGLVQRFLFPHLVPLSFLTEGKQALEQIFSQFPVDVIWATCPPASTHVLAEWASKRWGKPWVADFRDIVNQQFVSVRSSMVNPIRLFHEKRIPKTASEIITVSEGLAEILIGRHHRSIRVLPNGFDPVDLSPTDSTPVEKFNIVYTGSVLHGRPDFRPLLDALEKLISSGNMVGEDVSVEFYGRGNEKRLETLFRGHPQSSLVKIGGALSWSDCRQVQRGAAVLLQQAFPGRKGIITSKIFEYMAARRPVLAMPADNDCVEALLNKSRAGFSCTTSDEIANCLLRWYQEWKQTGTIICHSRLDILKNIPGKLRLDNLPGYLTQY